MDMSTVIIVAIAALVILLTLVSIYTALGPGAKELEDPFLNHSHGPDGHSHELFHTHSSGHRYSHTHGHAHDHSHPHAHTHKHSQGHVHSPEVSTPS